MIDKYNIFIIQGKVFLFYAFIYISNYRYNNTYIITLVYMKIKYILLMKVI